MTTTPPPADTDLMGDRRKALIERLGTFADLLCSKPLPGASGDVAYDLLRQAAAQMSSDHMRLAALRTPSPVADEALVERGWQPIETAPRACHVLAARFDADVGEWVCAVVASPPSKPFTYWKMIDPPRQIEVKDVVGGGK